MNGIVYALLAAAFTAIAILINKAGLATVPPLVFGAWRSVIVVAGFLIINTFLIHDKKTVITRSDLLCLAIAGGLSTLSVLTVLFGQSLTTAINTGFLLNLNPLFILILAPLLVQERIRKEHVYSLILMIGGAFLILTEGRITFFIGDLLIIATALSNAVSNLLQRKSLFNVPSVIAALVNNMVIMTLLFGMLILQGFVLPTPDQFVWIGLSGAVLILFWASFFQAMKTIGASATSLYQYASPVLVVIGAYVLLGESITLFKLAGGAAILLGAFLIPKNQPLRANKR